MGNVDSLESVYLSFHLMNPHRYRVLHILHQIRTNCQVSIPRTFEFHHQVIQIWVQASLASRWGDDSYHVSYHIHMHFLSLANILLTCRALFGFRFLQFIEYSKNKQLNSALAKILLKENEGMILNIRFSCLKREKHHWPCNKVVPQQPIFLQHAKKSCPSYTIQNYHHELSGSCALRTSKNDLLSAVIWCLQWAKQRKDKGTNSPCTKKRAKAPCTFQIPTNTARIERRHRISSKPKLWC